MNFLLLNSPIYRNHTKISEDYLPPLGLAYIATHLNNSGVNTVIVDCVSERFGVAEILELIETKRPDFVGFNIFTQNYEIVKEVLESCSIITTFIIGGQFTKFAFNEIVQWQTKNNIWVVIGESELVLPAIVAGEYKERPLYNAGSKKVYRVDKHSKYFPHELDEVKLDRFLLKEEYLINHYGKKEAAIITSRGCPYNCAFCGAARSLNQDTTIRFRTVTHVEDEIRSIFLKNSEITSIRILDDLFLRNRDTILSAITIFEKFNCVYWRCMAQIMAFRNSMDLFPDLRASGCSELFFGIESGSSDVRKRIGKVVDTKLVEDVLTGVLEAGIDVKAYFMFGFPDESTSEAEETFKLASKLKKISDSCLGNFRTSVFQFRPYHGTRLYNEIKKSGKIIDRIGSNDSLNVLNGRSQFNFHSGNFSNIEDCVLNEYILKTQALTEA